MKLYVLQYSAGLDAYLDTQAIFTDRAKAVKALSCLDNSHWLEVWEDGERYRHKFPIVAYREAVKEVADKEIIKILESKEFTDMLAVLEKSLTD